MNWIAIPDGANVEMGWIATLIDNIGTSNMDHAMLEAVNDLVPVEEISGYLIDKSATPFGNCGRRADSARRAQLYADRFYARDPLRKNLSGAPQPGRMLIRTDQASRIQDDHYRWECFDDPRFRSRVSIVRTNPDGWAMIQFFLAEETPCEHTITELCRFSVAAFPAARRHFNLPDWEHRGAVIDSPNRIEARLAERFPTLTAREREVCALTIAARNSRQIAVAIGVTPATVLTYRRRAYERLGISSAAQLVTHLM